MKATDLMIGDWVKVHFGEPNETIGNDMYGQVAELYDDGRIEVAFKDAPSVLWNIEKEKGDEILPVPLTPEILEKNGLWEKDPDRSPNCLIAESNTTNFNDAKGKPHSWVQIQDISSIECMRWYIKIWGKGNLGMSGYIGYVHELQHALRLCGIDKEITL